MSLHCPHHPNTDLVEDHRAGDVICPECGLVVGDRLVDVGTEWRSFSNERSGSDPSRVGAPELQLPIGRNVIDMHDRMTIARRIIREMSEGIHLTNFKNIQDSALETYRKFLMGKSSEGKKNEALIPACLFYACRKDDVPRTYKEIAKVSRLSVKRIWRCYKLIQKDMKTNLKHLTSADLIDHFCGRLNLPNRVKICATHIAKRAVEIDLVAGRSPISIAATAIYMASRASTHKKTAKEVGEICGSTEVTIKQNHKLFFPRSAELFPEDFKCDTPIDQLPTSSILS